MHADNTNSLHPNAQIFLGHPFAFQSGTDDVFSPGAFIDVTVAPLHPPRSMAHPSAPLSVVFVTVRIPAYPDAMHQITSACSDITIAIGMNHAAEFEPEERL